MHVGLEHGRPDQVGRVKLLQVVRGQELVVFVQNCVFGFLHFLGQVLEEGAPLGGTAQTRDEISADSLLLLGDEDQACVVAAEFDVIDGCLWLNVTKETACVFIVDFDDLFITS